MTDQAFPTQRHPNCQDGRCKTCLDDCLALAAYIEQESGLNGKYHDFLGKYRQWFDQQGIASETKWGWPAALVYEQANIERFIEHLKAGQP